MRPDYRSARQTPEVGNDPAARPSRLLYSTDITRCAQAWKRRRRMTICSPMVDGHRAMALCALARHPDQPLIGRLIGLGAPFNLAAVT